MSINQKPIQILAVAGSLRKGSFNRALIRAAKELLPDNVTLVEFDISNIPLYNGDVEAIGFPESVQEFRQQIATADALLIATPEYNYSIPGVLKNAIDWASRGPNQPFFGKPLGLMGVGGTLGTGRSQYHLRQVSVVLNMYPINKPEVLIQYSKEKFDDAGNLIDPTAKKFIREHLKALAEFTRTLSSND